MIEKPLKIKLTQHVRTVAIFFCASVLWNSYAIAAEDAKDRLHRFLKNDMAFSEKEFKSFKEGQTVTKKLKTATKHEVGMFSIAKINVSKDFLLKNYSKKGMNLETAAANSWGIIKTPPQIEALGEITLPKRDIKDLANCKPGKCKVKAPVGAINKIIELDAKAPEFEQKANQLLQQDTVDYVNKYLKDGNKMLVEYGDKKKPVRLAEQFKGLMTASPYLKKHVPDLYAYLDNYPNSQLPQAEDTFMWIKEELDNKDARPILSVNHMVVYQPDGSSGEPIVALKQLYATHYFEANLSLTVLFEDVEGSDKSVYLLNVSRARIDILREVPGFLAGKLYKGARDLLHKKMETVKRNMEKSNPAGAGSS